jgi:DNA repair protein RecO
VSLYKAEGVVLRTRNLGEADKIVTLFTAERGKVEAAAKGARRPRSRLLGPTQLFTHGRYLLFERQSLDTLSQGEIVHSFLPLREDLLRMAYASYVAELVDRLTELNDPHPRLFSVLVAVLRQLAEGRQPALTARYFELQLLQELGFRPHLSGCVRCGAQEAFWFGTELGGLICERCRTADPSAARLDGETVEIMRFLLRSEPDRLEILRPSVKSMQAMGDVLPKFCLMRAGGWLHSLDFLRSLDAAESQGVAP